MAGEQNSVSKAVDDNGSAKISRVMLAWLNQYPDKQVKLINFEYLPYDQPGMALSTVQSEYKIKKYLRGRYKAQYQFKVVYRLQPSGNDERLYGDELLNDLVYWIENRKDKPILGPRYQVINIDCNMQSSLFGRYDNGDEDHQIFATMQYCFA